MSLKIKLLSTKSDKNNRLLIWLIIIIENQKKIIISWTWHFINSTQCTFQFYFELFIHLGIHNKIMKTTQLLLVTHTLNILKTNSLVQFICKFNRKSCLTLITTINEVVCYYKWFLFFDLHIFDVSEMMINK